MNDTISTLSLLIVFQTVFYDILSKDVSSFVQREIYGKSSPLSRRSYKKDLIRISIKVLFLFFSYLTLSYLLIPETISIISNNKFSLWTFDIKNTLFVFIEIYLIAFTILSFELVLDLIKTVKKFINKK